MKKKIAIIGAGPAGLTAAYLLAKEGVNVDIYEADSRVGGMAKSVPMWGQIVDLGPHRFFSSDPRVNKLWLSVIGKDYAMVSRLTRIFYRKKFYFYPLKPFNALFNLGVFQSIICVLSYVKSKIFPSKGPVNFESWVVARFGYRLYSIFFKSYSEKLWGIKCTQLDSDFATQRIKKLSLFEAIKNALFKFENKHKTLVDEFAYPLKGAGQIYEKMAKALIKNGGNIFFKTPVHSIMASKQNKNIKIKLNDQSVKSYDHVISTMPLTNLVKRLNAPNDIVNCAKKLKFRNTILVYLKINDQNLFPDQWIYVHSAEMKTGRITNFSNWLPSINRNRKDTILCLEYWCNDGDPEWTADDKKLIDTAINDIILSKLVNKETITEGKVIRVPKCYPVYSNGYKNNLKPIENYLNDFKSLSVIGRYGSFKYNNQDHSILMGIMAADNIVNNANYNLWEINTDYEYQETSKITATGLEQKQ